MTADAPAPRDPLAVFDVNTIWRRKPFESLGELRPVLAYAPADPLAALRARRWPGRRHGHQEIGVWMPPGWATRFAGSSCRRLARLAAAGAARSGRPLGGVFVTSPHYLPIRGVLDRRVPLYYYCSDDYSSYAGWGGEEVRRREGTLVREAAHSFFVSRVLAERAVGEYGVPAGRVSVSPNATEEAFFREPGAAEIARLLAAHPGIRRPVVGVIGGINERLDFDLLRACAEHPAVGTLLLVGPVDAALDAEPAWRRLLASRRCVAVGARPHAELPLWMAALDLALIPYRPTPLNLACSPMRLFDGLAAGVPLVATDACAQVREFSAHVRVAGSPGEFVELVAAGLAGERAPGDRRAQREFTRSHTWAARAAAMVPFLPL